MKTTTKTTTKTKKEYRQPQILAIGDAVESSLGFGGGEYEDNWILSRYNP